jgi:hypothetical protein
MVQALDIAAPAHSPAHSPTLNPTLRAVPSRPSFQQACQQAMGQDIDLQSMQFHLPDPEDDQIADQEFERQVDLAWVVCDRFDLQTDIWRGRILKAVRDREKRRSDRSIGFLNWLKEREISKSHAYDLMELATSADSLLEGGILAPEDVNAFSKRAFVETAQAAPEVQQMIGEAVQRGDRITRREVRQLSDDWTAVTSELLPSELKEKAANNTIPTRYIAPLVKEMEKLPELHQVTLRAEVAENPDVDTVKQVTNEARYLAKYLNSANQVQILNHESLDIEAALEEALRIGCLSSTAELVNQAAQVEQLTAKLYTTWRRLNSLSERVYLDSGSSTPNLRSLLSCLEPLTNEIIEVNLGDADSNFSQLIRLKVLAEEA